MGYLCADRWPKYTSLQPAASFGQTSGVAPLFVFCSSIGSSDATVDYPFHECYYLWEVWQNGALASLGNWTYGRQFLRARAWGPLAAFYLDAAGTYTIRMKMFNGYAHKTVEQTITVTDPDTVYAGTDTIVITTDGDFSGKPTGATEVTTSDFETAIGNQADGKRVLFRKGQSWTSDAKNVIVSDELLIGAWGSGSLPTVNHSGANTILEVGSSTVHDVTGLRVRDLILNGNGETFQAVIRGASHFNKACFLGLELKNFGAYGFEFPLGTLDGLNAASVVAPIWNNIGIFETYIHQLLGIDNGKNGILFNGTQFALAGCRVDNEADGGSPGSGAEHNIRANHFQEGVFSNLTLEGLGVGRSGLTLRSVPYDGSGTGGNTLGTGIVSKHYVATSSRFVGDGFSEGFLGGSGPINDQTDGRVEDGIWEKNKVTGNGSLKNGLMSQGKRITFRNNVENFSGCHSANGIRTEYDGGVAPPGEDVWTYNNSFYRADLGTNQMQAIILANGVVNPVAKNNLAYAPAENDAKMVVDSGATNPTTSNNSSNAQVRTTNPFILGSPVDDNGFELATGSPTNYAVGTGDANVPVYDDYNGVRRTFGNKAPVMDLGALKAA